MLTIAGGILIAFLVLAFLPELFKLVKLIIIASILGLAIIARDSSGPGPEFLQTAAVLIVIYYFIKLVIWQYNEDKRKHPNSYPIWKR